MTSLNQLGAQGEEVLFPALLLLLVLFSSF